MMLRSLLMLTSLWVALAYAQPWQRFGSAQGMSNVSATRLMVDSRGYVWVATREGLNRFDGSRFNAFMPDPTRPGAIPHGHVERMHEGPDGRIWLTSGNGGLTMYDPVSGRFSTWEQLTGSEDPARDIPTRAVHALAPDSILVGVFGQGIWLYMPSVGEVKRLEGPIPGRPFTPERIRPLAERESTMLVMSGEMVAQFDPRAGQWELLDGPGAGNDGLRTIFSTVHPGTGMGPAFGTWGRGLWLPDAHGGALRQFLPDPTPPLTMARNIILAVAPLGPGEWLVGTERGLFRFKDGEGTNPRWEPIGPEEGPEALGAVRDLLVDVDGTVWIAHAHGLAAWSPASDHVRLHAFRNSVERSMPSPAISGAAEVDGRLVIGTRHGDGLMVERADGSGFDAVPHASLATEGYAALQVMDMIRLRDGRILALAGAGLFEVDGAGAIIRAVHSELFHGNTGRGQLAFFEDRLGHWWFGKQGRGLIHVDPHSGWAETIGEEGPAHRRLASAVWCQGITGDRAGRIWVNAYEHGISRISEDRSRIDHFDHGQHPWLPTGRVWDLAVDDRDRLWLATNGHGIVITPASDPGGEGTQQIMGGPGAMPSMVSSIHVARDGFVWAAGPSGLFRIDPTDLSVSRMDAAIHGLPPDLHHAGIVDHPSGRVTVSAADGRLLVFDDVPPLPFKPPRGISIRSILVNGAPWVSDTAADAISELRLAPGQQHLEIEFAAIAHVGRHALSLEHHMEGVDPAPHRTGADGRAVYSTLPPGTHRFVVHDVARVEGQAKVLHVINVHVQPHFWRTWWFRALMVTLALGVTAISLWWRITGLRERDRLASLHQRRLAEMEMQALRAQMNPHFIFNSLNSINRFIIRNDARTASEYLTKFSRLMRGVLHNSKERLVPLKDELETLRLYVELEALRFSDGFRYEADIQLDEDPATVMVPPMLLQPYVENAIWHGLMHKKEGARRLVIRTRKDNGTLTFEVEDNGVGQAASRELGSRSATDRKSMGMRITEERLGLVRTMYDLDTSIQVIDLYDMQQRPAGTKVVIRISERRK